ncbi:MAG TPA: hypothetical protein VGN95_00760 [Pyrinomonadaceae bacterium]|nr:hypothetical protein [Pyrinomonadaceae bacterium]
MPGRCPSCNQTYTDETLSFCPNDGTPLIKDAPSSYDPQATMIAPPPQNYAPQQDYPPQQGYYAPQGGQTPPPQGGQTPPPGWQQPPPQYGQQPPPYGQQQQQQYAPQYGAPAVGSKSKLPLIIALAAILLIGGGIAAYFLMRDNSSKVSGNTNTYSTSNANRTSNTTTTTMPPMPTMPSTTNTSTPSTTSSTTSSSDYTEDEKHKLFQAVGITRDNALIVEVAEKIGISDSSGNPNSGFQPFIKEHFNWALKNAAWVQEYRDPQKAREYVMANK